MRVREFALCMFVSTCACVRARVCVCVCVRVGVSVCVLVHDFQKHTCVCVCICTLYTYVTYVCIYADGKLAVLRLSLTNSQNVVQLTTQTRYFYIDAPGKTRRPVATAWTCNYICSCLPTFLCCACVHPIEDPLCRPLRQTCTGTLVCMYVCMRVVYVTHFMYYMLFCMSV